MTALAEIKDLNFAPYGAYGTPDSFVIHDRKYRPLVRLAAHEDQDEPSEEWGNANLPGAVDFDCHVRGGTECFIRVLPATAQVVDPEEWIEHDKHDDYWFYSGEPDRTRLQDIVDSIPGLGAEIQRRDAEAAEAKRAERAAFEWQAEANASYEARLAAIRAKPPLEITETDLKWFPFRERIQLENKIAEARYEMRKIAVAEWNAFEGIATQPEIDAWRAKHASVAASVETAVNIVTSDRFVATARKEAAEANETVRARRFNAASLEGKTPPALEWVVQGLIPAGNVTLLYGDGGTGKSLLTLQLAVAAQVAGSNFFGRPVKQCGVEFVTAEDDKDEIHRRLSDICKATGVSLASLSGLHITSLVDADAVLAREGGDVIAETALYRKVERILVDSKPGLLVLDTLADVFGGNEIVRAQARRFIGMLRHLCIAYGCTIIVLAHPSVAGMNKGTSGSTGWSNSVRSRLFFARVYDEKGGEMDEDARVLQVGKLNYGRVGLEIPMRWSAGVFVPERDSGDPMASAWKAERVFLDQLAKHKERNSYVTIAHSSPLYAPRVFSFEAKKEGVSLTSLKDAMQRLLERNKIENAPFGAPSKNQFRLYSM